MLPEVEVFLGEVPIAPYETPGGKKFAETILPFVKQSNVIILANHGTVSYGESVERAYWWTEVLDAYCRILILARQLGPIQYLSPQKTQELIDLKAKWGFTDPRLADGFQRRHPRQRDVPPHVGEHAASRRGRFRSRRPSDA